MHELLDTLLKYVEQDIWCDLKTPFLESFGEPEELLEVLRELMIIVDAIQAEFDV